MIIILFFEVSKLQSSPDIIYRLLSSSSCSKKIEGKVSFFKVDINTFDSILGNKIVFWLIRETKRKEAYMYLSQT